MSRLIQCGRATALPLLALLTFPSGPVSAQETPAVQETKPAAESPNATEQSSGRLEIRTAPELDPAFADIARVPEGATEIYATEGAGFDIDKRTVTFSGNVKIIDPRFQMKATSLTVFLNEKGGDIDRAVAEGDVAILHLDKGKEGAGGRRSVGRAAKAVYVNSTGEIELTGQPQLQQGDNVHVATSPSTKMVITRSGQLRTTGPSKTLIKDREATKQPETKP